MTKKYAPALILIACFVVVAFLTMIYGFTHAAPFDEKPPEAEKTTANYSMPNIVPAVWLGNN
ncbi:MAG: hypothetical protein WBG42_11045 [Cryomorphaceae bacterium]